MAAACAGLFADQGLRTLLVSTDPAHSTADLLGMPLGNAPRRVRESLWALEIDAEADAEAHVRRIARDAEHSVSPEVLPTLRRHLDLARHSPGTVESAMLDRFAGLIGWGSGAETAGDAWDRIVFDTAPTGHTLRLLALPGLLTTWVEGMVRQRERVRGMDRMLRNLAGREEATADPVVARLRERRDRLRATRARLLADAAFWLVLIPERLAIEETARALRTLEDHDLTVSGLIVNRVLPDEGEGAFLRARLVQQRERMAELAQRFPTRPLLSVAHAAREISAPEDLPDIARQLDAPGRAAQPPM
ncbi:MAG: arsenic transporter [Nitriliruptorales bacterium]|nr:arsenic transporter [Nitriliruptorales bacterium]